MIYLGYVHHVTNVTITESLGGKLIYDNQSMNHCALGSKVDAKMLSHKRALWYIAWGTLGHSHTSFYGRPLSPVASHLFFAQVSAHFVVYHTINILLMCCKPRGTWQYSGGAISRPSTRKNREKGGRRAMWSRRGLRIMLFSTISQLTSVIIQERKKCLGAS